MDIAVLVRDALIECGCASDVIGPLDGHSTISMDFHNRLSMHIASSDSDILIWARLPLEAADASDDRHAAALLRGLLQPLTWARGKHAMLRQDEDSLDLMALIHPDYLQDGKQLSLAITGFFEVLDRYPVVNG